MHKTIQIKERPRCDHTYQRSLDAGLGPLAANVVARRVAHFDGDMAPLVTPALGNLCDPRRLPDAPLAAERLASAVADGEAIGIVTDYDVDGITSHALIMQALNAHFGHPVALTRSYIGHRLEDGYGLSDNVCERILADKPRPGLVITADCGTSDAARISRLRAAGVDVIVTDHHSVPDAGVPRDALAIVNPSRPDNDYPDPLIAGCMVAWLLMSLLRVELVRRQVLPVSAPKLSDSLDLVALGTVADAVSLFSPSNRAVVLAGLDVLNRRKRPCWQALAEFLKCERDGFNVDSLGFQIGPRINARGRMADPFAALRFLQAKDAEQARHYLQILDEDNQQRRLTEKQMLDVARLQTEASLKASDQIVCAFDREFHAGVQGIVASRLVEAFGRVTAVLSPAREAGLVSGSLRSVDGVDVAAALRNVASRHVGLLQRFGGHPKAAGVTLKKKDIQTFRGALAAAVREQLGERTLHPVLHHDGALEASQLAIESVHELARLDPFGRGFEPPRYCGTFSVEKVRPVGSDPVHLSLELSLGRKRHRAIWFRALASAGDRPPIAVGESAVCIYRLAADSYRGGRFVQLIIEHAQTTASGEPCGPTGC